MTKQNTTLNLRIGNPISADELRAAMLAGMKSLVHQMLKSSYKEVDAEGTEIDPQVAVRQAEFDEDMAAIVKTANTLMDQDKSNIQKALAGVNALAVLFGRLQSTALARYKEGSVFKDEIANARRAYRDVNQEQANEALRASEQLISYISANQAVDTILASELPAVQKALESLLKDIS